MIVNIDEMIYKIVCGKYSSVEYIIEETLPTISIRNLISVVETLPSITNTVSVDISESAYNEIVSFVDEECSVDDVVNYLIGLGFVLEV